MLYKKLSFEQLRFTEEDRIYFTDKFSNSSNSIGYGTTVHKSKVNSSFLNYIYDLIPYCKDTFMIIKGIKDSDDINIPGRHIHSDDRLSAINIPLINCKEGADTVFYEPATLKNISFPNPTNSTIFLKQENVLPLEIGRFTLTMDSAYLLNTSIPHCKIQTYNEYRMLLSISIDLSFQEATNYFE